MPGYVTAAFFYHLHYAQGYLDQLCARDYEQYRWTEASLKYRPLSLLFTICAIGLTSPGATNKVGSMFHYPMYESATMKVWHVLGTWVWLLLLRNYGSWGHNLRMNDTLYTHCMQSSIMLYLTHWLYIDMAEAWFLWSPSRYVDRAGVPHSNANFGVGVFITLLWTSFCLALTYLLVLKLPYVGVLFGFSKSKTKLLPPPKRSESVVSYSPTSLSRRHVMDITANGRRFPATSCLASVTLLARAGGSRSSHTVLRRCTDDVQKRRCRN
ncbi:MAG: hypothetical protein MHM6MM_000019 [Cercozoa sp. M6MM]